MATAYDTWKTSDPADDSYESDLRRQDEIVAIVERQMDDVAEVAGAVSSLYEDSAFDRDIARVLTASTAAFEAEAIRYFRELRTKVRHYLEEEAASLITDNESDGPDEPPMPWD